MKNNDYKQGDSVAIISAPDYTYDCDRGTFISYEGDFVIWESLFGGVYKTKKENVRRYGIKAWDAELDNCIENPFYFFTNYFTVNGLPLSTKLSEENFNKLPFFIKSDSDILKRKTWADAREKVFSNVPIELCHSDSYRKSEYVYPYKYPNFDDYIKYTKEIFYYQFFIDGKCVFPFAPCHKEDWSNNSHKPVCYWRIKHKK